MATDFKKIIKTHFEPRGFSITPVSGTRHWNVLRLHDSATDKYYIAKGILHIDGDKELGPTQMDKAFNTETYIISNLPKWWGLSLKDHFTSGDFRILVTLEIENCKWSSYNGKHDDLIANALYKQISWLHSHNIAHTDLELKNVLLSCDNKNATIIDFEKAIRNASSMEKADDYRKLIHNLSESESTLNIARKLIILMAQRSAHLEKMRRKTQKLSRK